MRRKAGAVFVEGEVLVTTAGGAGKCAGWIAAVAVIFYFRLNRGGFMSCVSIAVIISSERTAQSTGWTGQSGCREIVYLSGKPYASAAFCQKYRSVASCPFSEK